MDLSIDIPSSLHDAYRAPSEYLRKLNEVNGWMITTQDTFMRSIAASLRSAASKENYGGFGEASFLLAWVQSLPYTSDSVTTPYDDYPRFPVETLYDNGGDCEDTTFLYITIMIIWDYRVTITVDDVTSYQPWKARMIRVYGTAEDVTRQGHQGQAPFLRVKPDLPWSFGIEPVKDQPWKMTRRVHM